MFAGSQLGLLTSIIVSLYVFLLAVINWFKKAIFLLPVSTSLLIFFSELLISLQFLILHVFSGPGMQEVGVAERVNNKNKNIIREGAFWKIDRIGKLANANLGYQGLFLSNRSRISKIVISFLRFLISFDSAQ